jgi:integrase/recombinase XerD
MSAKIRLGKTGDSRTRGKAKTSVGSEEAEKLKQELKGAEIEYIDHLLGKGYSTTSIGRYVNDAERFKKWIEKENVSIEEVSYTDILHYVQSKRNKVSQRTQTLTVNSIRVYFDYLSLKGWIGENPTRQVLIKGVKRRSLYDILNRQELDELYHKYQWKESEKDKNQNWYKASKLTTSRNKVIIGLLIYQGLSVTDISRLEEKDLKLREGKIFIDGTRKSNERTMTLESVQILDLMEYVMKDRAALIELSGKESDKLIVSRGGGKRMHSVMEKVRDKLSQIDSRVKNLKQIRASVITYWLKVHNLRKAQYLAGHRYVSSTEAY